MATLTLDEMIKKLQDLRSQFSGDSPIIGAITAHTHYNIEDVYHSHRYNKDNEPGVTPTTNIYLELS